MYYNNFLEHLLVELEYYNSFFIFMNRTLPVEFLMKISVIPIRCIKLFLPATYVLFFPRACALDHS